MPLSDALWILCGLGVVLPPLTWLGARLWYLEDRREAAEDAAYAPWEPPARDRWLYPDLDLDRPRAIPAGTLIGLPPPAPLADRAALAAAVEREERDRALAAYLDGRPRCHACGAADCPAAGTGGVDSCPLWQDAEARADRGEYLPTRPAGRVELVLEPGLLEPDTDRMATIAEMRDAAEYQLAATETAQLIAAGYRWYEETFQTGQFRAVDQ